MKPRTYHVILATLSILLIFLAYPESMQAQSVKSSKTIRVEKTHLDGPPGKPANT